MSIPNVQPVLEGRRARKRAPGGGSWLSLVAGTTLGLGRVQETRVRVVGRPPEQARGWRLVVQSFCAEQVDEDGNPVAGARPLASAQKAVRSEELKAGVVVDLLEVGRRSECGANEVAVFAWVEPGQPDFDFDGLLASPGPLAWCGAGQVRRGVASGSLQASLELSAA